MCSPERRRRPRRRRPWPAAVRARRAFTLIELLLAIGLLSAMLALLFAAFSQITGGAAAVQRQVDERQRLRLLIGLIADDLSAAQYLPRVAGKAATKVPTGIIAGTEFVQQGRFTRIDLHAGVPARFHRTLLDGQDPGLHEIGYRVRLSEDRTRVELARREDFYLDEDLRDGGIEAPLADQVTAFLIEFLPAGGQSSSENLENWLDVWNSPEQAKGEEMPVALRVTLRLRTPKGEEIGESIAVNFPAHYRPFASGGSSGQGSDANATGAEGAQKP